MSVYDNWKLNQSIRKTYIISKVSSNKYGTLQSSDGSINGNIITESQMSNYQAEVTPVKEDITDRIILTHSTDAEGRIPKQGKMLYLFLITMFNSMPKLQVEQLVIY